MNPMDPSLQIGSVELAVSDLQRSVDFYTQAMGLQPIEQDARHAILGPSAASPALTLTQIDSPTLPPQRSAGLYHVAWLHPSRAALAETIRRLVGARWRIDGASDHGVSEALYLSDPDRLGIEIYVDRPREQWQRPASGSGVTMFTAPLDLDDLLAQSTDAPAPEIDPATIIGHVHLKVSDVPAALAFYRDTLGFEEQAELGAQAAFVSAGGYHHHLGLNSWESRGGGPAPESAPGLRRLGFELSGDAAVRDVLAAAGDDAAIEESSGGVLVSGPDSQLLSFAAG
jgi:catechol 2,3-dioxygenase